MVLPLRKKYTVPRDDTAGRSNDFWGGLFFSSSSHMRLNTCDSLIVSDDFLFLLSGNRMFKRQVSISVETAIPLPSLSASIFLSLPLTSVLCTGLSAADTPDSSSYTTRLANTRSRFTPPSGIMISLTCENGRSFTADTNSCS